jgi:excisionase family DNA binding protein
MMTVSTVIKSFNRTNSISRSTIYAHMNAEKRGKYFIDDDTYFLIKQCWHNGRWHYKNMLTVEDVSRQLHVSPNTIYRLIKSSKLNSIQVGNQYFFSKQYLNDFVSKATVCEGDVL